jgi:hypothetical protein
LNPVYVSTGPYRTVDCYREHLECWQQLKQRLTRESKGFWTEAAGSTRRQVKAKVERQAHGFSSTLTSASPSTSTFASCRPWTMDQ